MSIINLSLRTLPLNTDTATGGAGTIDLSTIMSDYEKTMYSRYEEVKGKTTEQLTAMNIQILDGSYFKDNRAWLSKDWVDKITGKYDKLMIDGQYAYPLDIPQDIMAAVVDKYGATMTKDEMIALARQAYAAVAKTYDWSDALVQEGIQKAEQQVVQQTNTSNVTPQTQAIADKVKAKNNLIFGVNKWIVIGVAVIAVGAITVFIVKR